MITCLSDIFADGGFIETIDGLRINNKGILNVKQDILPELICLYVDITARLGVEIAGLQLPLIGEERAGALTIELNEKVKKGTASISLVEGGVSISASNLEELSKGVQYLVSCYPYDGGGEELRRKKELAGAQAIQSLQIDCSTLRIAEFSCLIKGTSQIITCSANDAMKNGGQDSYDKAKHHFKENLNVRVVVGEHPQAYLEPLLLVSLRMAMENFQTIYPYAGRTPFDGKQNISFHVESRQGVIRKTNTGFEFVGNEEALYQLALTFIKEEESIFESHLIKDVEEIFSCKNEIGQAIAVVEEFAGERDTPCQLTTQNYSRGMVNREKLELFLSERLKRTCKVQNFNDGREVLRRSYERSWEGDDFLEVLEKEVLPQLHGGDAVKLYGVLSEDLDIRISLEQHVQRLFQKKGIWDAEVNIYRSFKSGHSWIEESVIPTLCASVGAHIDLIKISFPYLLNGYGDDTFEDESTPNYGRHLDNPHKFFDIPTRWLQELFPIDELISEKLNIPLDAISFVRDDKLDCTYRFEAFDSGGAQIYENKFCVKYVQKEYMKRYPQIGKTHVTTGWIKVVSNKKTLVDQRIITDTEKVWAILEDRILPELEDYLVNQYGTSGLLKAQPLFNRLQLTIDMSEIDFELNYRQERISTLEAMQEDMYFYILDWFKTYGERECGHELDNIGLIMPEPDMRKAACSNFEMILYEDLAEGAQWEEAGFVIPFKEEEVVLEPLEMFWQEGVKHISIVAETTEAVRKARVLNAMIKAGVLDLYPEAATKVEIYNGKEKAVIAIGPKEIVESKLSCEEKDRILKNEVVDYCTYLELLNYYRKFKTVNVVPMETTYKGKKIFVMEFVKKGEGICYAANKLKNERISSVFTARHHGNEASGLNSAFMLADKLLGELGHVLDKINIVVVPFVNIDGGMLHCEMQKKHPKWLCHPARYNSAGFEFRKDFDNPKTKYGEARLLGKLWNRWLFDVITDNHGFEGHELCQPFSGYISPWYKSFWIPRALYYGYIWFKSDYNHMIKIGNQIRTKVSKAINRDEEIFGLNQIFAERFFKYAQQWFPDMFRLDKFNDVVFYWIDTGKQPRTANYGMRYPEITAIDWTTEVADETAVGMYMETNARAHLISDVATLGVMTESELVVDTSTDLKAGGPVYTRFRRRPLCAREST